MKTHGLISPKGFAAPKIDLDRVPSAAALLSPKYTKKAVIPTASTKPSSSTKVADFAPKIIDAKVESFFCVYFSPHYKTAQN